MFYFFTAGLTEDEIAFATERVKGKTNRLLEKEKKEEERKKELKNSGNTAEKVAGELDDSNGSQE
jgi:hypothetical protein